MWSKSLRKCILGDVGEAAYKSPLPTEHILVTHSSKLPMDEIEVGSFYEIDSSKLPLVNPAALHTTRVVMVTSKTELKVTVRYPSNESLQAYFSQAELVAPGTKLFPELDEKFVMGPEVAVEVLERQISSKEFAQFRKSMSFWLMACSESDQSPSPVSGCNIGIPQDPMAKGGPLLLQLQDSKISGWGTQRVVAYVREPRVEALSEPPVRGKRTEVEEEENQTDGEDIVKGEEEEKQNKCCGKEVMKMEEGEEVKPKVEEIFIQYSRKKLCIPPNGRIRKKMKRIPKPKGKTTSKIKEEEEGKVVARWPEQRREAAAKKLTDVLKAHEAVYGNPISRHRLREEARRTIGDTGLLDHLLKHLAGKVMPGGNERLRRRCDADGKMEYWLEHSDLVNIRKQAGVRDPYWTPPPGWKPGDCITSHNCICCQQVRQLKADLSSMKRQIAEFQTRDDYVAISDVALPDSAAYSESVHRIPNTEITIGKYELLLRKKAAMEEQLVDLSKSLTALEGTLREFGRKQDSLHMPSKLTGSPFRATDMLVDMKSANFGGSDQPRLILQH